MIDFTRMIIGDKPSGSQINLEVCVIMPSFISGDASMSIAVLTRL